MKKIKIAVQFFGHLRTFEECANSIKKNLLSLYDCDVFIHSWNKITHSEGDITYKNLYDIDDKILKKIEYLYEPKLIQIDEQKQFTNNVDLKYNSPNKRMDGKIISNAGLKSMYFSKSEVNKLRQNYQNDNGVTYDYVIMIRPDIKLLSPLNLHNIFQQIETTKMTGRFCLVNIKDRTENDIIGNMMSDIVYFSTPKIMDNIISTITELDYLAIGDNFLNYETLLNNALETKGITNYFLRYFYDKDWQIIRLKKNISKNFIVPTLKEIRKKIILFRLSTQKKYVFIKILPNVSFLKIMSEIKLINNFRIILVFGNIGRTLYE